MKVRFGSGLRLKVKDRDRFKGYLLENVDEPGALMDNWVDEGAPELLVVEGWDPDDEDNPYRVTEHFLGDVTQENVYDRGLLESMVDDNILEKDGNRNYYPR